MHIHYSCYTVILLHKIYNIHNLHNLRHLMTQSILFSYKLRYNLLPT